MANEKVLIVDDEASVRKLIKKSFARENILNFEATCGKEALEMLLTNSFDLIILDIMMKDMDGLEVLKKIRDLGMNIPILLLSGKAEDYDQILGLGIGADDYITKPFSPSILCARVKAHIRRNIDMMNSKKSTLVINQGPFEFNLNEYKLYKNGMEIILSTKETMLMKFFLENPNRIFSKEQLYQKVWGDTIIDDNSIMVYIRHLRTKTEDNPKIPKYIQTVWGIGYKFVIE